MTRECITHHYACNCREAEFAAIKTELDVLRQRIESAPVVQCQKVRVEEGHAMQTAVLEHTHERIPGGANSWIGKRVRLVIDDAIQEVKK